MLFALLLFVLYLLDEIDLEVLLLVSSRSKIILLDAPLTKLAQTRSTILVMYDVA